MVSLWLALTLSVAAFSPQTPLRRPPMLRATPVRCSGDAASPPPAAPGDKAARDIDSRGFVIPQVGDVVKMPSKWPGEWEVGQVDYVQFIGARASYEVDLLPLTPIGNDLYRLPGKKPSKETLDLGKIGRCASKYVPERDAYFVAAADLEPLGGRKPEDPEMTAMGLAEYAELKATLIREAALLGVAGTVSGLALYGPDVSFAVGAGAVAACVYLALLQKETDSIDKPGSLGKVLTALVAGRLGVPFVLFAVLSTRQLATAEGVKASLGIIPKEQFAGAITGFLSCAPLHHHHSHPQPLHHHTHSLSTPPHP